MNRLDLLSFVALGLFGIVLPANAKPDDFYAGKVVTLTIGSDAGGGYDQYARVLARHMSAHIPGNPIIVPKNMPGAGSLNAARRIYVTAPKDGTEFGTVYRGVTIMPLLGFASDFDARKFTWIGSPNKETAICLTWHTSPIKTFADTLKQTVVMGTTAKGADLTSLTPSIAYLLGAKFNIIRGYDGGPSVNLAMTRGEIDGRCGVSWTALVIQQPKWLSEKQINIFMQMGFERRPELPDVPLAQDVATTEEDKQIFDLLLTPQLIAYPYFAPPGVPPDRAEILRSAFTATLADPDFRAEAAQQKLEIQPVGAQEIDALLTKIYATTPEVMAKAKKSLE